MKNSLLILGFISLAFSQDINRKKIAITFDDSPRRATGYLSGPERSKKLVEELEKHDLEVIFFSNSEKLNSEGIKRLQHYNDANHIIANHTHSHPDINKVTLTEYTKEILLADSILKQFSNFKKFYRYPYLREGNTLEKRNGIRDLLKKHGYINAYITANNYDWYIEHLFQKAIKDGQNINFEKMKQFYVQVLIESIEYYDQMAIKHLGYSPKHVLLLHEMDISALFIGDLVIELRKRNWKIISPLSAYEEKIANFETEDLFKYNPGRIGEIARENGQEKFLWHKNLDEKYLENRFKKEVLE